MTKTPMGLWSLKFGVFVRARRSRPGWFGAGWSVYTLGLAVSVVAVGCALDPGRIPITGQLYDASVSSQEPSLTMADAEQGLPRSEPPRVDLIEPGEPAAAECDLRGHWVVAQRTKTVGLGGLVRTIANNWHYWEIAQRGEDLQVVGGVNCGTLMKDVSETPLAEVTVPDAFNGAMREFVAHTGRRGTVSATPSGCAVDFARHYVVLGVTPEYLEPSVPLPSRTEERATDDYAGWQDWDDDHKPGVTLVIHGTVSGEMHLVQRDWTEYSGEVHGGAQKLRLSVRNQTEQVTLPSSTVTDPGNALSSHPEDHFLVMQRLPEADIARGDALATCDNVLALSAQYLPEAEL